MSGPSLRRRLLLLVVGIFAAVLSLLGTFVHLATRHEIDEIYDAELAEWARTLAALQPGGTASAASAPAAPAHEYETKLAYLVRDAAGRTVARSPYADLSGAAGPCNGYAEQLLQDVRWTLFCLPGSAGAPDVWTGQKREMRQELERNLLVSQLAPYLLGLPFLGLLAWLAIGRALAPLEALSRQIAGRSARNLEPVPLADAPREVAPLVAELNRLLGRVGRALDEEKRFTAEASHELRTPLAALRVQTEVALSQLPPGTAPAALGKVIEGVDRASRLVEQLLALARLDEADEVPLARLRLAELAADVRERFEEPARAAGVRLQVTGDLAAHIQGNAALLQILLGNLLDNALRYTPRGGEIAVRLAAGELVVEDSGPGIPAAARERLLQRFVRGDEARGAGSGLGLSIVARIAELHRARLQLGDRDGGGLRVTVTLA